MVHEWERGKREREAQICQGNSKGDLLLFSGNLITMGKVRSSL
jgi:hypothetical protein